MPVRSLVLLLAALVAGVCACTNENVADREGCQIEAQCDSPALGETSATPRTGEATPSAPASTPAGGASNRCSPPYPPAAPTASTVFCADPALMQQASVVRIVDGDTLRALVDGVEEPIRLFGVDTPERGERCFDDATDALRALVAINGGQVLLVRDARNRDTYDRLLRYVYTPAGLSIDALLVSGGYGYAWTRDGALRDPLVELEHDARAESRGCLWR